ncbi:MAG: DUF4251 domain-containing protein [Gillisia sp.]|nr:DUF4251 domain-containing protein [Gillisia sp.]
MKTELTSALKKVKSILQLVFLALGLILMSMSCGSTKDTGSSTDQQNFEQLRELVNSREFEIENDWAVPLRLTTINLIGNSNFIRFKGDSVEVFLPYFGVRHSGGGYGASGGIEYEGPAEDLSIEENMAKNNILIKFEGRQGSEHLQFIITLFTKGNTSTSVNSSDRDPISYWGNVKALPAKKQ